MIIKIKYNKNTHLFYPMYKNHWYEKYKYFDEDCSFACDASRYVFGYKTYKEAFNIAKDRQKKANKKVLTPIMDQFTISCTQEQTRKALELGAPIEHSSDNFDGDCMDNIEQLSNGLYAIVPTAEQMLNWLRREKGFKFLLSDAPDSKDDDNWWIGINEELISSGHDENKELAAIDAALDYLIQNKNK